MKYANKSDIKYMLPAWQDLYVLSPSPTRTALSATKTVGRRWGKDECHGLEDSVDHCDPFVVAFHMIYFSCVACGTCSRPCGVLWQQFRSWIDPCFQLLRWDGPLQQISG
uniref:Uncharacterized protein n=1 Tax=Eutreptiella gymnastica TaxID=73025 RepID=A0A7S4LMH8_9EUGL